MASKSPADKKVLDKILNPSKKKVPPGYMTKLNEAEKLTESFIKSIADVGRQIKSSDACNFTDAINKMDSLSKALNLGGALKAVGKLAHVTSPKWEDIICMTIPQTANLMIEVIEAVLILATKLFRKIDKFRKKIEAAIKFFIQEVRNCLINMIMDLTRIVDVTIKNIADMSALIALLDSCPCLKEILLNYIPSKWKKECENKTSGAGIVACIKRQVGTFGEINLLTGLNQLVQEHIINKLVPLFDALEDGVHDILDDIIKPFRWAIKLYCRLLNKPLPAPFIDTILSPCLFVHTKENGRYRMSVIQYLQTLKLWVTCFQGICGSLSDDLTRKIKESNEDLRLDIKYWLGSQELDIYWSCIAVNNSIPEAAIKEIWTKVYIDPFKEMLDFIKDAKDSLTREERQPKDSKEEVELDPLQEAISITNGADNEMFPITKGHLKFYSALTEKSIVKIIQNIGGVINYHNYYERFNELLQWEQPFIKSQNHLDTIISVRNRVGAETDDFEDELLNDFYSVLPTYRINDDYTILTPISKPEQLSNESMVDYYTRWYDNTILASS